MRKDMSKVIVERPRRGGGWRRLGRPAPLDENAPAMPNRREKRGSKYLNENLAPLRRFLERNVGRHWPKVYAEIAAHLSPRNAVQQHVRDHLADFVAMRTDRREGVVWVADRFGGPAPLAGSRFRFYVHPTSGILLRNRDFGAYRRRHKDKRARDRLAETERRRDLGPDRQLHKIGGLWFELRLAPWQAPRAGEAAPHDAALPETATPEDRIRFYGWPPRRAVARRSLSGRELGAHGLANDSDV